MNGSSGFEKPFPRLQDRLTAGDAEAVFALLAEESLAEKNYAQLFEARLLAARRRLGLPLLASAAPAQMDEAQRRSYDEAVMAAAREAGTLFLEQGEIARAWPYFRALGEPGPVADAIGRFEGGEQADAVIEIALGERVNPLRGLELILTHHGTCRAITLFDQYPDAATREAGLRLLVKTLHAELRSNLIRSIEQQEGSAPAGTIPELIAGREWLFGEYDYYVDTSHLISVLRFTAESADRETIAMAVELARYGEKLAPMFHHKGDAPLDDVYVDHKIWLRAFAGEDVEGAVGHFRAKVDALNLEETGTYPAQVLVRFLVRLERYREAIAVFEKHLTDTDPAYLMCPNLYDLCRLAGDYERLRQLAVERGDPITYAAASLESDSRGAPSPVPDAAAW
ncbi:MAG: hypothetical protein R2762_01595 [Bryobacteraceae bacterium]